MIWAYLAGGRFHSRCLSETVDLAPYRISVFPVTIMEFAGFVAQTGYLTDAEYRGQSHVFNGYVWKLVAGAHWRSGNHGTLLDSDLPVVHVSRRDAEAFCNHYGWRLPRPEEWEAAATDFGRRRYPWGDDAALLSVVCAGSKTCAPRGRSQAPERLAARSGCLEMLGNVWEWTSGSSAAYSGCGVFMGGGWWDPPDQMTGWMFHDDDPPDFSVDDVGFRVVAEP